MSTDSLKKFAEELKKAREDSNFTIDQIFSKTRIDKKYIQAIEDGNFSIMPDVYIRAFIKEYSKAIKLDAAEVMGKYELAKKGLSVDSAKVEESNVAQPQPKKTKGNEDIKSKISEAVEQDAKADIKDKPSEKNKTLYYALTGILMLLFIFVIYKVFLTDSNNEIVTEKPFEEIMEDQVVINEEKRDLDFGEIKPKDVQEIKSTENNIEQKNIKQDTPIQPVQDGIMTLTILGTDKSWIRVVADDNNMEFMIDKGINKVITAQKKFYLHIGNSGGVNFLLDNKKLKFSGLSGKVRKIFVTRDGIEYLRRTPNLNEEN